MVASAGTGAGLLRELVESVLDVNSEGASLTAHPNEVDPRRLITQAIDPLGALLSACEVVVETHDHPGPVWADPELLRRMVMNLVANAVRHVEDAPRITISAVRTSVSSVISVIDNGVGISSDRLTRIFDMHYRVTVDNRARNRGLGLAFCRLAAESHGGEIGVDSNVGSGSTFCLKLPSRNNEGGAKPMPP